jgi:arsenate reductase (thioredoxin)
MTSQRAMTILFLCTSNSCRSQMAEGWTKKLKAGSIDAYSAGVEPHAMDQRAVKAMAEAGVDISGHRSKHLRDLPAVEFDFVVTLCGHAQETCPFFPGKTKVVHRGFEDPPLLAREAKSEEDAMAHYRRVRDDIRAFVETLPDSLDDDRGFNLIIA